MPYANNKGIHIYYEVEGEGSPLVLMHGLTGSLAVWREGGYREKLGSDYQLVLVDARGHGESDKPHEVMAYRMELKVSDIVSVLDDLGADIAHYFGYSMGGFLGFGIAHYAPERFHSLVIGGSHPYERTDEGIDFWLGLFSKGMQDYIAACEMMFGSNWSPELEAACRANDLDALSAFVEADRGLSFEHVLPDMSAPCLLYVGEDDDAYVAAKSASEVMPNATFISFPGFDHVAVWYQPDSVLLRIREFLADTGAS